MTSMLLYIIAIYRFAGANGIYVCTNICTCKNHDNWAMPYCLSVCPAVIYLSICLLELVCVETIIKAYHNHIKFSSNVLWIVYQNPEHENTYICTWICIGNCHKNNRLKLLFLNFWKPKTFVYIYIDWTVV